MLERDSLNLLWLTNNNWILCICYRVSCLNIFVVQRCLKSALLIYPAQCVNSIVTAAIQGLMWHKERASMLFVKVRILAHLMDPLIR